MTHALPSQRAHHAVALLAILLAALLGLYEIRTHDTFFHLATGRFILEHGAIPRADPFSFSFHSAPWYNQSWGYQALLATIHACFGFAGLSFFQALLAACTAGLGLLSLRRTTTLLPWAAMASALPHVAFREVLEARPHMLAFVCLGASLYLILRVHAGTSCTQLVALLPLYAMWTTVHGSHLLMFATLGIAALGCLIERRYGLAATFAGVCAGLLVVGLSIAPDAFRQGGEHVASSFLESSVREWAPVTTDLLVTSLQGRAFLLIAVMSIFGAVPRIEDTEEVRSVARGWMPGLQLTFFLLLGFTSLRMLALCLLATSPLWVPLTARGLWRIATVFGCRASQLALPLSLLGLLALSSIAVANGAPYRVGVGLMESRFPVSAVATMRRRGRIHRVYNAYNFGAYLMWQRVPVLIDGRAITVYPARFLETFERAYHDPLAFEALCTQYAIDGVLLPTESARTQRLLARLRDDPRFELVRRDEVATLFERRASSGR